MLKIHGSGSISKPMGGDSVKDNGSFIVFQLSIFDILYFVPSLDMIKF